MDRRRENPRAKMTLIKVWQMVEQKVGLECKWGSEVMLKCEGHNNEGACEVLRYL